MQNREKLMAIAAGVLLVAGVWFCYAGRNDVFNFGERTNRVKEQLSDVGESQSRTAESLGRASDLAGSAEGRAEKIERGNQQLQSSNEETKKSLENANAYLTKLEKEEKHKIRVKERQRNLWIGVSSGLLYAWIRK